MSRDIYSFSNKYAIQMIEEQKKHFSEGTRIYIKSVDGSTVYFSIDIPVEREPGDVSESYEFLQTIDDLNYMARSKKDGRVHIFTKGSICLGMNSPRYFNFNNFDLLK